MRRRYRKYRRLLLFFRRIFSRLVILSSSSKGRYAGDETGGFTVLYFEGNVEMFVAAVCAFGAGEGEETAACVHDD